MANESVKLETAPTRAALLVAAFVCLAGSVVFAKWCLADAIAARTPFKEVAEFAVGLAPGDPQTHYALAVLGEKNFSPEELEKSLDEFERATALAPEDFRLWLELGRARERRGDAAGAEAAMRRALQLAPNYALVEWTLGNFLLRSGRTAEGFDRIRRAAETDEYRRAAAIAVAWQIFDGDVSQIERAFGGSANLSSTLAVFAARQKRFDEAANVWNALAAEEKQAQKENGEQLLNHLVAAKKYRAALTVLTSLETAAAPPQFAPGKIYNGDFELDLKREKAGVFDWQIADGVQPQIGYDDAQRASGSRSLKIIFNSSDGRDFRQISQIVAVETVRKYTFAAFYKSELKTTAALHWEIADAADGKVLAATDSTANAAEWTLLKTEFTTGATTEAITVRLVRDACKSIICPITGKVWFDNFSLD